MSTAPIATHMIDNTPTTLKTKDVCSDLKMIEIRARATNSAKTVKIDCSVNFRRNDLITKRMIFEGSNATAVVCNCNGATIGDGKEGNINYNTDMIEIRSEKLDSTLEKPRRTWERPHHVTIKNCKINGSVRVWGMGKQGQALDVKSSSKLDLTNPNHTQRARNNAPTTITFDRITITGIARNLFYLSPGVTFVTLKNSELKGKADYVGIYLDTESAYNTIKNNNIHVKTKEDNWGDIPFVTDRGWPQIAIDGSSHNKIIGNRIAGLNHGGIYLYRNCGEGGTIRHTPPEHNQIINNNFFYRKYKGSRPAIYLGSRDYGFKEHTFGCNCGADDGRPYGSSKSDKDYARHNIIIQNQFYKRKIWKNTGTSLTQLVQATPTDLIVTKNRSVNSPNHIVDNEMVSNRLSRKTGCYVADSYKDFLLHGESLDVTISNNQLICAPFQITCDDGELVHSQVDCAITEVPFECKVQSNNRGCSKTVQCPAGQKIVGAKVACNLEFGNVPDNSLSAMSVNQIKVVKKSDDTSDGSCFIGSNKIRKNSKSLEDIFDKINAVVGCKERDQNGGDCHVKGILFCR